MADFWAIYAAGLLVACAGQGAQPAVLVAPPPPGLPAAAEPEEAEAAPEPPRSPCEVLGELTRRAKESFPSDQPGPEQAPCVAGKGGAYTMTVTYLADASSDYGPGYAGRAVLWHADAAGRVARSKPITVESTGTSATLYGLEGVVDYDRDGTDELLVKVTDWEFEANGDYHGEIWHVAGESVEPYGGAAKLAIVGFEDVNQDGVPEVLLRTPFQGVINGCGADGMYLEFGPKWALHAGASGELGFDEVSRAELLRVCPKRPERLVPRAAGGVDNTELRQRLACAVTWGVSSQAIARELARDCPKLRTLSDECSYDGVLPVCVNVPKLVDWSTKQPPFKL